MARLGIKTISDLLFCFPRSYEDRTLVFTIEDLDELEWLVPVFVRGRAATGVMSVNLPGGRSMQKARIVDDEGSVLNAIWFNQNYMCHTFKAGVEYIFYGTPEKVGQKWQMTAPQFERVDTYTESIMPIYSLTAGVTNKMMRQAVRECAPVISEVRETLPEKILRKYKLCGIRFALKNIHFPLDFKAYEKARHRLVFEELLMLQLSLRNMRDRFASKKCKALDSTMGLTEFVEALPFKLTLAQQRVMQEIMDDLKGKRPMSRLLQGDVGCGKTILAAIAMFIARTSCASSVMMAPTEILAEQHFDTISRLFDGLCEVVLVKGGLRAKEKRELTEKLSDGRVRIIIGTHAVLEDYVEISHLGLVITDEQHRFGVNQREKLTEKGNSPHFLVMSATPIPRTLAMIVYGDLDISIIDELPPNRKPVQTHCVNEDYRLRINEFMRRQIEEGRQIYIVCPLIEESEKTDLRAATELAKHLQDDALADFRVALLHGRIKAKEKAEIMEKFALGEIDALVSTTVIEVGIDVPNASVMVIENAERFGLSQLHQLRGRVGRGDSKSYCIMFNQSKNKIAVERMKIMKQTSNGFEVAQRDLELRGAGDFFGTRQHGIPQLKIANLYEDLHIWGECMNAADVIIRGGLDEDIVNPFVAKTL